MTISNDMAALVGFGCEAFFYGAFSASTGKTKLITHFCLGCYTVLFAMSIILIFYGPHRGTGVNKYILIISALLYFHLPLTSH